MEYLEYQKEGIKFALARKGTLIADEMGLGKTIQGIGVINNSPECQKILVACPASLKCNWRNELDKWLSWDANVSIANYEQLENIHNQTIDLLILDEAHFVKNPKSERTKAAKRLAKGAKKVVLLTGTPIENRPIELWTLLQIVNPEYWDPSGWAKIGKTKKLVGPGEGAGFFKFALRYCGAHKKTFGKKSFWSFEGASNLDELKQKLRETCMIRRLKADVLGQLPAKQHQIIVLPSKINEDLLFPDLNELNYEECIRKLQTDKVLFTEYSKRRHDQGLEKVELVAEHILNCAEEGKKLIVFAHHKDVIESLAEAVNFGYNFELMTSDMSIAQRQKAVDNFQNKAGCRIIIGSIGVMGTGWTLTESAHVIFAEIDTVPGRMAQCVDRAHRIGQRDSVLAQYLVLNGSLDARICKILIKKQKVLNEVLG